MVKPPSLGLLGRVATHSVRARLAVAQVLVEGRPIAAAASHHIAGVRRRLNCNGDRRDVWLRVSSSPRRAVEDDLQRASSRAPARADEGARSRRHLGEKELVARSWDLGARSEEWQAAIEAC